MKQKLLFIGLAFCLQYSLQAQKQSVQVSGYVRDSVNHQPVSHATIAIKGGGNKTYTDDNGYFSFYHEGNFPLTVIISHAGFQSHQVEMKASGEEIIVPFKPSGQLNEVVITAVNKAQSGFMEAPVSVEYVGLKTIRNNPSPSYYNTLNVKKGVDVTTSSLTFNTISTRGFNGSGSSRVNQLVDGMDNQAPGLNFFLGNFVGLTELDVDNMELLPGASSALYGPGGMNGTILINSKSPFKYEGLSIQARQGVMNVDKQQRSNATPYYDYSLRFAKSFKDKFAFKIGAQYIQGTDWLANDSTNYLRAGNTGKTVPGTRATDPNYDGVNVYGDETTGDIRPIMQALIAMNPGLQPVLDTFLKSAQNVSRTGYAEKDLIDPITKNIKLSGALHYKLSSQLEAILMGYWATGNTVYTGNNRYALKDVKIGQYKLELKSPNWFIRSYTTQEDAGQAYSATVAAQRLNEAWKPSLDGSNIAGSWYPQYTGAFAQGAAAIFQSIMMQGGTIAEAQAAVAKAAPQLQQAARAYADQGRPAAGSEQFKQLFDKVRKTPIPAGGLFLEKSQLWMTEGQYDLSNKIKFVDLTVGGDWKKYVLNSDGTLFIDTLRPITFNEIGAYAQVGKKFFNDVLALSFSGRYDKNEDFKGKFTPRATALVKIAKDQNLRFSYQTAYRFPTTQQKYIRLDVGSYTLLGGLPWVMNYMNAGHDPVVDATTGQPYVYKEFKPESMRSFEVGYKAWVNKKLVIDAYGYWGKYRDFLGRNVLFQPGTGKVYSTVVNSTTEVKTYGFGASIDYKMRKNYNLFANAYSDVITDVPTGFTSFFNTPRYRVNAGFGNDGLGSKQKFGFNVVWHWQDSFFSDGDLASGNVSAFSTIDAQVTYKLLPGAQVKVGGSNILNHYYQNAYGNPHVGGLYYVSLAFGLHK